MENESTSERYSGTLLIVGILVLALGAAMFSWWFRAQATRRAMTLWGAERAVLIQSGKPVHALRLARSADGDGPANESIVVQGRALAIDERIDITRSGGLLHLRQALLEDRSLGEGIDEQGNEELGGEAESDASVWAYGLQFGEGEPAVLLVFSATFDRMLLVEQDGNARATAVSSAPISTAQPFAEGMTTFFAEQFDASTASDDRSE